MGKRYFGTDGIRDLPKVIPMTAEPAPRSRTAAAQHGVRRQSRHSAVIDTKARLCGCLSENVLPAIERAAV